MEVKPADFARMCGVSKAAVSSKIKLGNLVLNSARKLDTDNPLNKAYLDKHQKKFQAKTDIENLENAITHGSSETLFEKTKSLAECSGLGEQILTGEKNERKVTATKQKVINGEDSTDGVAHEMLNMTISQLVRKYGSVDAVANYSKILRDLSTADERDQKTQERRLTQIPKDFVEQRIFGYLNQLMNQLLDVPESICDSLIATVKAQGDDSRNELIRIVGDSITRVLSGAKDHIKGELESLRGKHESKEEEIDRLVNEKLEEMKNEL